MTGRETILGFHRRALCSRVTIALVFLFGLGSVVPAIFKSAAGQPVMTWPRADDRVSTTRGLMDPSGLEFGSNEGSGAAIIGEYEGRFDAATRRLEVRPTTGRSGGAAKGGPLAARAVPGGEVLQGNGFSFTVVNSAFINPGNNPATVSGEVQLTNNTGTTFYNTRLVFTAFKIGGQGGTDAGNIPGDNGFAYFNDGQIPYNGKLNISRYYGDIAPGGNSKRIWTFAVGDQPPNFFFVYRVLADVGVAAESIYPAAVQVNVSSGATVLINGRGFSGTPAVELLGGGNNPVAQLTGVTATATQVAATVPAGTAAGVYAVRVTNPGGTPGGSGSSVISGRLTVTGPPDGGHTISGVISSLPDAGPYLISGNATIGSSLSVPAGTVFYMTSGTTLTVTGGGTIDANGGIPGIPGSAGGGANPAQIVFTAQRSPGGGLPAPGFWGGIDATAPSIAEMVMRNVVVEYGGAAGGAQINLTGSGRKLRFTDSISRNSAGAGIAAGGNGDLLFGFSRSRLENNGSSVNDAAISLSANAALGLYDLDSSTGGTSVGDPSYYYSSANDFVGNQLDCIQIGSDGNESSNDFTNSGVLVGQGLTPLRIRGSSSNPAIVGAAPPADPAELVITPDSLIQLAPGMDLQAGDYPSNRAGSIAANGFAGFYLGSQGAMSNRYIEIDKIPNAGNFGSVFFARNALNSSVLNYVRIRNGGAGALGNAEVIVESVNISITNSRISNSSTGGLLEVLGAGVDTTGTTFSGNSLLIDTIAGGVLGDRNLGIEANLITPAAISVDPLGRGVFIVDSPTGISYIRFLNTTRNTVTIGGQKIPGGALRNIAGGGLDLGENVAGVDSDVGIVTGIAIDPAGEVIYFIDSLYPAIRAVNISGGDKSIGGFNAGSGNVVTFSAAPDFSSSLNGLAVNPLNGDVYVADSTAGVNKIFKLPANNSNISNSPVTVAGNGALTKAEDLFSPGPATSVALLQPRSILVDGSGNLFIADTGHGRVIRVDPGGAASLVGQFAAKADGGAQPYQNNPYTSGLAQFNGKIYIANGNTQDIARIDTAGAPPAVTFIAGTIGFACDYSVSNCGDGGPATEAAFSMLGSTGTPPLAGIAADNKGLFILDQGSLQRGRVRYINFSGTPVEVAGTTVDPGNIETIAGTGKPSPFDGGLATSGAFNSPLGVSMDDHGNLWITDTLFSKVRFVNRGNSPVTIFGGTLAAQTVQPGGIATVNKDVGAGSTDDVPVNQGGFDTPQGIFATPVGVFIADSKKGPGLSQPASRRTSLIRFINTTGQSITFYPGSGHEVTVLPGFISTIAGGSIDTNLNTNGDDLNPRNARFIGASDIVVDPTTGDIYVADPGQRLVRRINRQTGQVTSLNLPKTAPNEYTGISFDSAGRLLIANAGAKTILREKSPGSGFNPNGFDTILSGGLLNRPRDVVEGPDGHLYVTNAGDTTPFGADDNKILQVVLTGNTGAASIFLGQKKAGYVGDGGPISQALISVTPQPINVATVGNAITVRTVVSIINGKNGELIFTDNGNNAIRRIR